MQFKNKSFHMQLQNTV